MAMNPVGWFEIYVQNMDRAKKFYETMLNIKLDKLTPPDSGGGPNIDMWTFAMNDNAPGATGALVKMEGFPSGGNSVLVYFSCADCAVEAGRIAAAGGRVQQEKMSIGQYGFIALGFDTEGNMFGLHSMQ